MSNITNTEAANALATIVAAEALGRLPSNMPLAFSVARDWDDAVATYGQTIKIPFRGSLSVNDKAANSDYQVQAPSDTSVSVTLSKHKEVSCALVTRPLPSPEAGTGVVVKTMSENGVGIRVMISYQHLKGGHLVSLDCLYGLSALRTTLGVVVRTD